MAMDKIKRSFLWLRRSLEIIDKTTLPAEILGEVRPTLDLFGWDLPVYEFISTVAAGVATTTRLAPVPEGETHLFCACDISHNDPVGSKDMSIQLENVGGSQVALTQTVGLNANFFVALRRPYLVTAGSNLMGVSRNAIALGSQFTIRAMFIRLTPGEYLPGTPFG